MIRVHPNQIPRCSRRRRDRAEARRVAARREVTRLVERFRAIDLSFEGTEYYACVAAALDSPFRVDLVDYRVAAPHIRDAVDR